MDNHLVQFVGKSWSEGKVISKIGKDRLDYLQSQGRILRVPTSDDILVYPIFQFIQTDGHVIVKPQLAAMIETLKSCDPWEVAILLNTPALELELLTPVEWEEYIDNNKRLQQYAAILKRELSQ